MAVTIEHISTGVIGVTVSGRIEKSDINAVIAAVQAAKRQSERLNFLVDLRGFAGFEIAALFEDIRRSLGELRDISRYDRIAIVTDKRWVEWMTRAEGKVLPSVSIRAFASNRFDDARLFAMGETVEGQSPDPALHLIMTDRPDALAFSVQGKLTSADVAGFSAFLEERLREYSKVDVLVRLDGSFPDFDPALLFSGNTWATKFSAWRNLRRYALVGAPQMLGGATDFLGAMMPFDVRTFAADQEDQAWKWIDARPDVGSPGSARPADAEAS